MYYLTVNGILFSVFVSPNQQHMKRYKPQDHFKKPNLSVIKKDEEEVKPTKLIPIKKIIKKSGILLPPQEEKYIKAKDHDFL